MKCITVAFLTFLLAFSAVAQTPAPAPPAPAPAPAPTNGATPWSVGGITFSGLLDGYYSLNFNHPISRTNNIRNFDVRANQFSLNMAKLTLEHAPEPVGFRIDFGFGRAFDIIHSAEASPGFIRNVEQAYVSYKPARAKGLQLDFGKFVTNAGAEVIETHSNWNYSRSILFAYAIPYYHFGARASAPLHKNFTAGASVTNGWNNVEDNNSAKTLGLTGAITTSKVTWSHNYYVGPEKAHISPEEVHLSQGLRHLYDTTLLLTPNEKANFYINFDYGVDKRSQRRGGGSDRWVGIAGAARFAVNSWFALSPRLEWFHDADGITTGTVQKLKEFTMTGEFKMKKGVFMRTEYRRDWSDTPYFDRGNSLGNHKNQDTLLLGFVAFFGGSEN